MIFLDGVGIGKEDYENNPFFKYGFKTFTEIFGSIPSLDNMVMHSGSSYLFPVDACLGVEGLPQSGTGQTSIFCGVNASKMIGKHFGPYPYSTLIPVIKEESLFAYFKKKNLSAFFANAYPKLFFDYIKSGRSRLSVTSLSCRLAGIRLNTSTDVRKGKALTAEITNERWNNKLGYKLRVIRPETAARRLLKIASENKYTLYEYFLTDHLGHGRYEGAAEALLDVLDRFLFTVLTEADKKNMTVLICSDHGNLEDISIKTHTFNPTLTISSGKYAEILFSEIKNLTQIKGTLTKITE